MAGKNYILGSGKIYITEFTGAAIPEDSVIEVAANQFGYTKGGASISYDPETYTVEDDCGQIKDTQITKETVEFKCGAMVSKAEDIMKVCPTAQISTDTAKKITTVKIGGIANDNGKSWVIRFVQASGNLRATVIGKNTDGFELSFSADEESVMEPTFTAQPMDDTGVLCSIAWKTA